MDCIHGDYFLDPDGPDGEGCPICALTKQLAHARAETWRQAALFVLGAPVSHGLQNEQEFGRVLYMDLMQKALEAEGRPGEPVPMPWSEPQAKRDGK